MIYDRSIIPIFGLRCGLQVLNYHEDCEMALLKGLEHAPNELNILIFHVNIIDNSQ